MYMQCLDNNCKSKTCISKDLFLLALTICPYSIVNPKTEECLFLSQLKKYNDTWLF